MNGTEDAPAIAERAGLRYITDAEPGIRRMRVRGTFRFAAPDGTRVVDATEIARIASLAIPPAYEDVWIAPIANGHLQATGRDARGRKQYRYHKHWREVRDETKFDRMLAFATILPKIRARTETDLARPGFPREKVLATIVRLLETTLIRVGNDEYARENESFGLTTLREDHAVVRGATIAFRFRGKSGRVHEIDHTDRRLAKIVARIRDLPGQELFHFLDADGAPHAVDSGDVNAYLHEIAGDGFTAKDFRTFAGTVACALALAESTAADGVHERKAAVTAAIERVARKLGNTPAVCRKAYVHPEVTAAFLESGTLEVLAEHLQDEAHATGDAELRADEAAVVRFLRRRMRKATETAAPGDGAPPPKKRAARRRG